MKIWVALISVSYTHLTVAAVLLSLFAALLYSKLRVDELDRQIAKTESNLTAVSYTHLDVYKRQ